MLRVRNISVKKERSSRARASTNGSDSGVKKGVSADSKEERGGTEEKTKKNRSSNIFWCRVRVGGSFPPRVNFEADCFIVLGEK